MKPASDNRSSYLTFDGGREELRAPRGKHFSLVMTGDCCPQATAVQIIRDGGAGEIFAAAKPFISAADVRLMQWETPLTEADTPIAKSGPNLRCPPFTMEAMRVLGIDTALLANNHIGDYDGPVVLETMRHIRRAGIRTVGVGRNIVEAVKPLIIEANGLSLAILNFAENEFGTATAVKAGSAPLAPLTNIRDIRAAAAKADHVIVVVHGGHERLALPSPRMADTYRAFIEAGASAVINCHTHCPGPIEIWQGAPIIYSPGNFFFPWEPVGGEHLNALWWIGYVPRLEFDKKGVYALETMPYRFDNQRMYELSPADRKRFWTYLADINRLTASDTAVLRAFEAWSAKHGSQYLKLLLDRLEGWPRPIRTWEEIKYIMPVRNLFTCETHHNMLCQYLRLIEEGRVDKAMKGWPLVEKLQQPAWAVRHLKALHAASAAK